VRRPHRYEVPYKNFAVLPRAPASGLSFARRQRPRRHRRGRSYPPAAIRWASSMPLTRDQHRRKIDQNGRHVQGWQGL